MENKEKAKWDDWTKLQYIDCPIMVIMIVCSHILAGAVGIWAEDCITLIFSFFLTFGLHRLVLTEAFPWYYIYMYTPLSFISIGCQIGFSFLEPRNNLLLFIYILLITLRASVGLLELIFLPLVYSSRYFNISMLKLLKHPMTSFLTTAASIAVVGLIWSRGRVATLEANLTLMIGFFATLALVLFVIVFKPSFPGVCRQYLNAMIIGAGSLGFPFAFSITFARLHKGLGANYHPVMGYLFLLALTSFGFYAYAYFIDLVTDRPSKHLLSISMFSLQLFTEISVSLIFVEADVISQPISFALLLLLVILVDLGLTSGFLYEMYCRHIKRIQSESGVAIYMAKKHQLIKQKMFAEPVAAASVALMTIVETFGGEKLNVSFISDFTGEKTKLGVLYGYCILIAVELSLNSYGSRLLQQRMERVRTSVWMELKRMQSKKNVMSIQVGGIDDEKLDENAMRSISNMSPRGLQPSKKSRFEISMVGDVPNKSVHADITTSNKSTRADFTMSIDNMRPSSNPLESVTVSKMNISGAIPQFGQSVQVQRNFLNFYPILHPDETKRKERVVFLTGVVNRFIFVAACIPIHAAALTLLGVRN